jgi:hypothetical protein
VKGAVSKATFAEIKWFNRAQRVEINETGSVASAASVRYSTRSPEGPHAVPLGNERKLSRSFKSAGNCKCAVVPSGVVGGGWDGCFSDNRPRVFSVFAASSFEDRTRLALLYSPFSAKATAATRARWAAFRDPGCFSRWISLFPLGRLPPRAPYAP